MDSNATRAELLQSLKRQLRQVNRADQIAPERPDVVSLGIPELDELLPAGGLLPGCLVEWLAPGEGAGAATLALTGVRAALAHNAQACWVVIDERGEFFPPAAWGSGVSAERLLLVRPCTARDAAWAVACGVFGPGWRTGDSAWNAFGGGAGALPDYIIPFACSKRGCHLLCQCRIKNR